MVCAGTNEGSSLHSPSGKARALNSRSYGKRFTSADFACTYEPGKYYVKDVLIVIPKLDLIPEFDLPFVAGVINSTALRLYYRTTFQTIHVQNEELASLPMPPIDFSKEPPRANMTD